MKTKLFIVAMLLLLLSAGCGEEFAAGVATGAAALQLDFIKAVDAVKVETARLNEMAEATKDTVILNPDTIKAVESLKGQEKNPYFWAGLASLLANSVWFGRTVQKKISEKKS